MSQTSIEGLHKDVMLEIFEYLDAKTLKSCALVCKQWDSIIGSSALTMKKLPLVFGQNWFEKKDEIKVLARKHHTLILDTIIINGSNLFEALSEIGIHVRHLELDEVAVHHSSFRDIIRHMKKLECLKISDSMIRGDICGVNEPSTDTNHLKSLVIIKSSWEFFDILCDVQVRELKVMSTDFMGDSFEKFLLHQSELNSLAIHVQNGSIYRSLARFEHIGYPFELKKLCVDFNYWGDDPSVDDCFIAFLKYHNSTLEDLETRKKLSERIEEFIMKHLKIKRLMTSCTNMPTTPLFYSAIPPNQHLKSLILTGELDKVEVARGLLHIYRGINKLVINSWSDEVANEIFLLTANNLKHLKHLEVPSLSVDTPELPNPVLKTFKVGFVDNVQPWQTFCVNNPSIEHLSVKWLTNRNIFTYEVLDAVTSRMPNLKRISLGPYFDPTARILTALSRNCPLLTRLDVFSEDSSNQKRNLTANLSRIRVTFFPPEAVDSFFPEEESMWDDVEKNHLLESDDNLSGDDFDSNGDDWWHEADNENDWDYDDYDDDMEDHDIYEVYPGMFLG